LACYNKLHWAAVANAFCKKVRSVAMNSSFQERLEAFIDQLLPEYRTATRQEIAAVLDIGAVTYPAWLRLIADPQWRTELRATACWVIGQIGDRRAFPALIRTLQDGDPHMRASAAGSLAHLRSRVKPVTGVDAVDLLIQAFLSDTELDVRLQSAFALRDFRDPRAATPLISVLSDPNEPTSIRDLAAEALAYIPDVRAIRPLIAALQDPDERVRFSAAYALGALNSLLAQTELRPAIAPLIAILHDPVGRVRTEAAEALGYLGDQSTIVTLERLAAIDRGVPRADDYVAQAAQVAIRAIRDNHSANS
jgi:HEAT repeat protein